MESQLISLCFNFLFFINFILFSHRPKCNAFNHKNVADNAATKWTDRRQPTASISHSNNSRGIGIQCHASTTRTESQLSATSSGYILGISIPTGFSEHANDTPIGTQSQSTPVAPPPAPPIAVPSAPASGPAFGYYQSQSGGLPIHPISSATTEAAGAQPPPTPVELDEYVDILQVQQLLLDSSAAAAAAGVNQPLSSEQQQHEQSSAIQQQQTTLQQSQQQQVVAKPRPRINLQKATEYAAQLAQGKKSNRMCIESFKINHYPQSLSS